MHCCNIGIYLAMDLLIRSPYINVSVFGVTTSRPIMDLLLIVEYPTLSLVQYLTQSEKAHHDGVTEDSQTNGSKSPKSMHTNKILYAVLGVCCNCESVRKKFHSRYHYVGSSTPLCTCN